MNTSRTFSPDQINALETLARLWSVERFVLIGASAMRLQLGHRSRETYDIDLVLEVALHEYPAGLESRHDWSPHPTREQAWLGPGNVTVDVLPAHGEDGAEETLTWPKSGATMTLTGFRLATTRALRIEVAPRLTIRVAPLEVIALLKMVSYLDRPHERERDLSDIALIIDEYVGDRDDRRFSDAVLARGLSVEQVSPFFIGRALGGIVNFQERQAIEAFIRRIKGSEDPAAAQATMLRGAPMSWHREPEELLLRFRAVEQGLAAEH